MLRFVVCVIAVINSMRVLVWSLWCQLVVVETNGKNAFREWEGGIVEENTGSEMEEEKLQRRGA